ncbi:membrane protein [Sphaerisporangium krabiense]|uniref:Putative ABC transport system permease protein n=1 Tax=Sphaerisporangium krabiense TaxID=763782 RepID=A0A7W8Z764_9ACTN|nr:FtsX-like permease family protein [Sphaerisporangium krabiense]MBB5628739.1 putative ABC transport system permease protein [Sphaerisporangium krabiense]GII60423.1 membrane protein [Sphaerisporangium krabiense]
MNPLLLLRVHRGAAAVLALLTLSASLLVAGLPRGFEAAFDEALRGIVDDTGANQTDLAVRLRAGAPDQAMASEDDFRAKDVWWRSAVPPSLKPLLATGPGADSHFSAKTVGTPVAGRLEDGQVPRQYVNVGWLSGTAARIRYVEGTPPGDPRRLASVPGHPEMKDIDLFEIALVRSASEKMRVPVGTTLILGNSNPMLARVTGLFEPVNPSDRYWDHNLDALKVTVRQDPASDTEENHITAISSESSLAGLNNSARDLTYNWVIGVSPAALNARNAADAIKGVDDFEREVRAVVGRSIGTYSQPSAFAPFRVETGLREVLGGFLGRLATAQSLMVLLLGGLAVVAAGVIALAVQLLTERMRAALSLTRARGASLAQVVRTAAGTVALAAFPAALIGYGLSYLLPGPLTPIVHLGPPAAAAFATVFAAARVALSHRTPLRERRDDVVARRASPRRTMLEVLVVVLALAGAYLLRTRGLTTEVAAAGADPFLMLVPAALTVAAALITLRCYPYPLRLVVWLAGRARAAVPFVGLTLAARARSVTALPVVILLPALAVSVYGAVVGGTLDATQRLAAWQATGADARVEREAELPADAVAKVRQVPGVRDIVPADKGKAQIGYTGKTATIVAVDLDAYRRLVAHAPLSVPAPPPDAPAPAIPALVSPDLGHLSTFEIGWHVRMKIAKAGVITEGLPGISLSPMNLIVVPYDASQRAGSRVYTNMLLIGGTGSGGGIDARALAAATGNRPDVFVETFDRALERVIKTPLTGTIKNSFLIVTIALAVYALLTVVIALVVGAADRARALSYLRTLGLSERQAARLTVLEIAPLILLTACAGLALGLALPSALGPGIDLSAYAGDMAIDDYRLDPTTPILLAAGLAVVALAGAFLHAVIGRRRSLGSTLRVGE